MPKPIIGISSGFSDKERVYSLAETYVESIKKAGGVPVLLPHTPEEAAIVAERIDALLISGGPDVDPQLFKEMPHPTLGAICPERDESELALIKAFMDSGKPILGICRGMQLLNVAAGGSLFQDLPTFFPEYQKKYMDDPPLWFAGFLNVITGGTVAGKGFAARYRQQPLVKHVQEAPRWFLSHTVDLLPETKLATIFGNPSIGVNSYHHLAVKEVAPGFAVTAIAPDGVIEGIERPEHIFCIGVQWHPECMFHIEDTLSDKLFTAFVQACD